MVWSVGRGGLGIVLFAASLGRAQDSGPPLVAPSLRPPAESETETEAETRARTNVPEARRPMLAIPGVTAPARTARKPATAETRADVNAVGPSLSGPRRPSAPPDPRVSIPMTLEPIPAGEDVGPSKPGRAPAAAEKPKPARTAPAPATGAGPGGSRSFPGSVLGRILGTAESREYEGDGITVESRTDPAVEAAVKRRIERETREALGDRADSIEVRVKGRDVLIRAHPSRFWRRWSVRRTLDALPMPAGYRGRAELID